MQNGEYRTVNSGVSPFWANKYARDAQKNWDAFYKRNGTNFFRDRHWTTQTRSDGFLALSSSGTPIVVNAAAGQQQEQEQKRLREKKKRKRKRKTLLEAGCGVGNSIWPILEEQQQGEEEEEGQKLQCADTDTTSNVSSSSTSNGNNDDENENEIEKDVTTSKQSHCHDYNDGRDHDYDYDYDIYAFDMSKTAIDLLRQHPLYAAHAGHSLHSFVWDISSSSSSSSSGIENSVFPPTLLRMQHIGFDIVSCIFMLSAVPPAKHATVVGRLAQLVKGQQQGHGTLVFRDYACGDLAQQRFKSRSRIDDNYFVRQDGTLSFFFDEKYVEDLMGEAGLRKRYVRRVERVIENRKEAKSMNRVFIQGEFCRRDDDDDDEGGDGEMLEREEGGESG